ncbi:MAG: sulfite exporter TauE/SafE family protein [Alphaproteobacteria bacterium]|nr:sulfite exporter TauE/SafE family protein [Alphaproteobacteria bacterium]
MTLIADPLFYLVAVPAVVFLGLSKGGFSGIGMVSTPMLSLILPPLEAAAILLPIILIQDAMSVWVYRRVWDPWNLKVMIPGCVVGVGAAWLFAAYMSTGAIRLVVGLIALGFVAYAVFRHYLPGEPPRPRASHGVFWGGLSGFTTTLIQIGAPPYYAFVLPQRLPKMIYVGTTVMFFAAANTMKIVPYFALGQFSTAGLATSFALFPLAILCNMLGIWLVRITPEALFYQITNVIVFLLGCELTRQGLTELLR